MITVPFTMTDELRETLLQGRTAPPDDSMWPTYVYAWQYPSEGFRDALGDYYLIWRDTETDKLSQISICVNNKDVYKLDMKDARNLMTGRNYE